MRYIDVILPLPLEGLFTYAVTTEQEQQILPGVRVLVPFGTSRKYLAMVVAIHDKAPENYKVKTVASVVDSTPMMLPQQLRLWQWIADYYICPVGEVMKAALPSGLKIEDRYRPRKELCIRLTPNFRSEQALHCALDMLGRASKQKKTLCDFLTLASPDGSTQQEVTREELLNESHCSISIVNALVERGILETYEREVGRLNHGGEPHPENIRQLNEAQQNAYNEILMGWMQKKVVLLHGVTSSGKTEIYIHLIQRAIDRHEQVLYLLPEIALTVQMMDRLRRAFGNRLGIYHSKYSDAERVEIWQKQLSANPYDIILGARSAVFLPFQHLGMVIVDEEHETSYKQQEPMPRYHARSAAIVLAKMYGAKTVLGTATPSMESYYNAMSGKYALVELKKRYQDIELPEITVVDVKELQRRKMMSGPFSPLLLAKMREAIDSGSQVILFQNRRGFAPMIECRQCGWVPKCKHCDVSLTFHRQMNQLTCHYCGFTYRVPEVCPCCESRELQGRGFGTEKLEEIVREKFPDARVARMDLDTTRTRNAYERLISDFSAGRTNILIGTQMISKGLDFDSVSVVGILSADSMMNYPDFRAYEHAFMMMAQVSGRAGRKGKRGQVILQTRNPELPLVAQVVRNDYFSLYKSLAAERQQFHYPPYYRLVNVLLKHKSDIVVTTASVELASRLRQWFGARVLGPDKPAVSMVKSLNIRKLVIKLENGIDMKKVRKYLLMEQQQMLTDKRYSTLVIYYDVDPL